MAALTESNHRPRTSSYGSCSDDDGSGVPSMIMTASLQSSCPETESDDGSLSSSPTSGSSPRSIFGRYWSSPAHVKDLEADDDEEDELMARLQTLKMPPMNNDDDDRHEEMSISAADANKIVPAPIAKPPAEPKKCLDDDTFDYQTALAPKRIPSRIVPRRQILPTPPPPTAISSSLLRPKLQPHLLLTPLGSERKCFSTMTLLKRPQPSCLRKSRYSSCSAMTPSREVGRLHRGLRNRAYPNLGLNKSVSFHTRVAVFEFDVHVEERGQKGWDKRFA